MRCLPRCCLAVVALAAATVPAFACLWDYDTLAMERQRFPSTLELITGKFLRHSREFYEWRVQDRTKKLAADPSRLEWLDDLAVAYDKTGRHAEAIETMERARKLQPRRYETAANLGTFYFHSGQLERGLPFIEESIAINPDAHFGREVYQKKLVEYVLPLRVEGKLALPLSKDERNDFARAGFARHLFSQKGAVEDLQESVRAAVKGVLGMMRFGSYDHPVLLEALGDLLCSARDEDAKLLASRAYLKASYAVEDADARKAYRAMAENVLSMQTVAGRSAEKQISLIQVEADLEKELADAKTWYAAVREDELRWLREGKDPEQEFTAKYYTEPEVVSTEPSMLMGTLTMLKWGIGAAWVLALGVAIARRRGRASGAGGA